MFSVTCADLFYRSNDGMVMWLGECEIIYKFVQNEKHQCASIKQSSNQTDFFSIALFLSLAFFTKSLVDCWSFRIVCFNNRKLALWNLSSSHKRQFGTLWFDSFSGCTYLERTYNWYKCDIRRQNSASLCPFYQQERAQRWRLYVKTWQLALIWCHTVVLMFKIHVCEWLHVISLLLGKRAFVFQELIQAFPIVFIFGFYFWLLFMFIFLSACSPTLIVFGWLECWQSSMKIVYGFSCEKHICIFWVFVDALFTFLHSKLKWCWFGCSFNDFFCAADNLSIEHMACHMNWLARLSRTFSFSETVFIWFFFRTAVAQLFFCHANALKMYTQIYWIRGKKTHITKPAFSWISSIKMENKNNKQIAKFLSVFRISKRNCIIQWARASTLHTQIIKWPKTEHENHEQS